MTPQERARHSASMTTEDRTPATGTDSIDLTDEWPPLREEPDEKVALAVEERKQVVREVTDRVARALLNEEVTLTDEDVADLLTLGNDLRGLAANLSERVPPSGRCEQREREESAEPVAKSDEC